MSSNVSTMYDARGQPVPTQHTAMTLSQLDAMMRAESEMAGAMGIRVNRPVEMISWCYSCITQIANAYAQVRPGIWRQTRGRGRSSRPGYEEVTRHPWLTRVKKPAPGVSGFSFRQNWATYLMSQGNVWLRAEDPDNEGVPQRLTLYGREQVSPRRTEVGTGALVGWDVTPYDGGRTEKLGLDELIHWRLPHPDPRAALGLAPHQAAQMAIDTDYARLVSDRGFFENGANPSLVLTYNGGFLDEMQQQQIRENLSSRHVGARRHGGVLVLPGGPAGFDVKVWGQSNSVSQYNENRKLTRQEIASLYLGFPVALLNSEETGGLSRSESEQARYVLYDHIVIPLALRMAEEMNLWLIQKTHPDIEFALDTDMVPVVLQSTHKIKSEILKAYVQSGVPRDDAVVALDLNLPPSPGGNVGFLPDNYSPITSLLKKDVPAKKAPPAMSLPVLLTRTMAEKFKRTLWEMRQSLLEGLEAAQPGRWKRDFAPLVVGVLEVARAHACGESSWADGLDKAALEAELMVVRHALPGDLPAPLGVVTEMGLRTVLDFLHATAEEAAEHPRQFLSALDRLSTVLAERLSGWLYATGRAAVVAAHGQPVRWQRNPACHAAHGAPSRAVLEAPVCTCSMVVVDEEAVV